MQLPLDEPVPLDDPDPLDGELDTPLDDPEPLDDAMPLLEPLELPAPLLRKLLVSTSASPMPRCRGRASCSRRTPTSR